MRVAATADLPTLPGRPSPWLGAAVGAVIGGAVFAFEYGLNASTFTAPAVLLGPMLGGWLAPAVRIDEPLLGSLSLRMAGVAVLLGAVLTPMLWSDGLGFEDAGPILGAAVLGLVFLGVPMLGVTLVCAMLWTFIVRSLTYR